MPLNLDPRILALLAQNKQGLGGDDDAAINSILKQKLLASLRPPSPERNLMLAGNARDDADMARYGNLASGLSQAAAKVGGTRPAANIITDASRFQKQADASRDRLEAGASSKFDPKILSYLGKEKGKDKDKVNIKWKTKYDPKSGETREYPLDTKTGKIDESGGGRLVKSEQYQRGRDVRKDYTTDKRTANTKGVEQEYNKMIALLDDQEKGAPVGTNDIGIITTFMRFLDPQSVVRESEFIIAARAGGLLDEMLGKLNNARGQGMLTPDVRAEFRRTVDNIWETVREGQNKVDETYRARGFKDIPKWTEVKSKKTSTPSAFPRKATKAGEADGFMVESQEELDELNLNPQYGGGWK